MAARRSRGDGGLSWDDRRKRWTASLTVGHTPTGKRIVKRGSGRTKTDTLHILHSILRRSITRAQARDKVTRNVVLLCDVPQASRG